MNFLVRSLLFSVFLMVGTGFDCGLAAKEKDTLIDLRVSLERSISSTIELRISLTNQGKTPFLVYSGFLPWHSSMLQLIAIPFAERDSQIYYQSVIKPPLVIDDPAPGISLIPPGKVIEERVSLSNQFPMLMDSLKNENILICWGYPLLKYMEKTFYWYQGYLVIPKLNSKEFYLNQAIENTLSEKCSRFLIRIGEN